MAGFTTHTPALLVAIGVVRRDRCDASLMSIPVVSPYMRAAFNPSGVSAL
jgi:hypothetical protein